MSDGTIPEEEGQLHQALLGDGEGGNPLERRVAAAVSWTLAANVALLAAKTGAFYGSMAILASTADSLVDLASQALIALTDASAWRPSAHYPAGKAPLESLGVIGCAFIMMLCAVGVVYKSSLQLYAGFGARHELPQIDMTPPLYAILAAAMVVKAVLWWWCYSLRNESAAVLALAEDNANDAVANAGAIITAAIAAHNHSLWWSDPAGGIGISVYILASWTIITRNQIGKIVGRAGPEELIQRLTGIAAAHDARCSVVFIRAYHGGQRLLVDVELEAPGEMTTLEATALVRRLRAKLEELPEVGGAAVFVVSGGGGGGGGPVLVPGAGAGDGKRLGGDLEGGRFEEGGSGVAEEGPAPPGSEDGAASAAGSGLAQTLAYTLSLRHSPSRCLATAPLMND